VRREHLYVRGRAADLGIDDAGASDDWAAPGVEAFTDPTSSDQGDDGSSWTVVRRIG
jgi:hypothetical protein